MHSSSMRYGAVLGVCFALGCGATKEHTGKLAGPPLTKGGHEAAAPLEIITVGDVPPEVASITHRIWMQAAHVRKLKPTEPVKLAVLPGSELVSVVKLHVKEEIPGETIRAEGRCFEALGLLPPKFDYEAETYSLLEEELAGLYMPEDKTMYVARGIADDELDATLSHELVHALQDQHFQIGKRMKYQPGASDALGALQALAEGDATSAMIDQVIYNKKGDAGLAEFTAADLPDRDPEEFLAESLKDKKKDAKIRTAPRFISLGLIAPYADGMAFVNGLRRRGGWAAVDAAWAKPPVTSEQLMHLEKYDANEPAIAVSVATASALGAAWKATFDDGFGEEEGRIAFGEWMGLDASKRAAKGWGGDHVTLFEADGGKKAVVWRVVYDDEKEANEAGSLLVSGWTVSFGAAQKIADVQVWGAPQQPKSKEPEKKSDKPKKGEPPPLPQLPDAPGSTPTPKPVAMVGCRALRVAGKAVTMIAGAPCDQIGAWEAEVGKAP